MRDCGYLFWGLMVSLLISHLLVQRPIVYVQQLTWKTQATLFASAVNEYQLISYIYVYVNGRTELRSKRQS
jgi:hypothetical protein